MADQQASDTPGVTGDTIVGGDPIVSNGANGADKYAPRLPDAVRRAAARAEELQQQLPPRTRRKPPGKFGRAQRIV